MGASRLDRAVARYEGAIANLELAETVSAALVLEALIARDAVHLAMSDRTRLSGYLVKFIRDLDDRLSRQAPRINAVVNITDWRDTLSPTKKDWWWLIDKLPWFDRYDWLWSGLSLVFLTISLSLLLDISNRFLSGGPDTAGAFAVIIPSVLTLLAGGGALTKTGRQALEHVLSTFKIARHWWDEAICAVSFVLLIVLLCFWLSLPQVASIYKSRGDAFYCVNQTSENQPRAETNRCKPELAHAEEHYSRAISLDSSNMEAQFRLGRVLEDLREYQDANFHYRIAARGEVLEAYNGLARLELRQPSPSAYAQAGDWLSQCLEQAFNNPVQRLRCNVRILAQTYLQQGKYTEAFHWVQLGLDDLSLASENDFRIILEPESYQERKYTLMTYMGWVLSGRGNNLVGAENQLRAAIALVEGKPLAHCILADVLDKQTRSQEASAEWELCYGYINLGNQEGSDSDEILWLNKVPIQRIRRA